MGVHLQAEDCADQYVLICLQRESRVRYLAALTLVFETEGG